MNLKFTDIHKSTALFSHKCIHEIGAAGTDQPPLKLLNIRNSLEGGTSYPSNCAQSIPLTQSIAKMIALDCQPFSIVDDEGFNTLMKMAKPR